jgi:alpha-glucosidase (family GH31 glycosyl hydrolase)
MRARSLASGLALALAACSSGEALSPAPIPLDVAGGFNLRLSSDRARLTIASADGRVLLDGLPPATLTDSLAAPLFGFGVRDLTTTYEMQAGSFKPQVHLGGPWRVARSLARTAAGLDLLDEAGATLGHLRLDTPEDGHLVVSVEPGEGPERHFTWGFACDAGDHFAGFGAQSMDVDHRGFTVPTWVMEQGIGKMDTDTYGGNWPLTGPRHASQVPIPQYLAKRGYVLTTETDLRSIFALCSESETAARVEIDLPAKIHLFDGPTPKDALARATATFGRPRMPPDVAFAPWLDAIYGDANVRAVAEKLRAEGIPSSVIWTEDWRGGDQQGDDYSLKEEWEVDPTLYPDMKGLADHLHGLGFDWHVYFNPFVYKGSKAWDETAPFGFLVQTPDGTPYTFLGAKLSTCGEIDLDNPSARTWAVGKMRKAIENGADGWMNDFAEWLPTDAVTFAGPSLPRHNVYPVLWQETAREAIDGVHDGHSRLFFARSGWFGTPALADVVWAGDQSSDFKPDDGMPTVLPIGIGLGVVGISTFGHDVAGYQSLYSLTDKELFFRWTALGAFTPVMRTHHGTKPLLEWNWQKDAETTAHFKRYTAQHMALFPYLKGLARVAADTGLPIWRGLMLAYPQDETTWGIKDEVMLGDGVLLAPVMTAGATSRSVYLPKGTWYPWAGGAAVSGGGMTEAPAELAEIPVYAAAGAVVPTLPEGVMTLTRGSAEVPDAASVGDDRVILAFLGASGAFTEAGGLGYAIEHVAAGSGARTVTWQGAAVKACDAGKTAPCVESGADGVTAYVTGPGTLTVSAGGQVVAKLSASGGKAERKLRWVVRGP